MPLCGDIIWQSLNQVVGPQIQASGPLNQVVGSHLGAHNLVKGIQGLRVQQKS